LIATGVRSQNHSDATVEFAEALAAGTQLTLFSADKPDRFFRVIKFWIDETSGIAVAPAFPLTKSKMRKAEFIYCSTSQSTKRMKTAGAFGGPIRQDLIRDLF
jgi:hypothetical protein